MSDEIEGNAGARDAWLGLIALTQLLPPLLDSEASRASDSSHYEYFVLSRLAEEPLRRMRLSALAAATNASLSRLSHVMKRLEARGLVTRIPCEEDGRATNAVLTDAGVELVETAAPGHVEAVRDRLLAALTADQVTQLGEISTALVGAIDPARRPSDTCASIVGAPSAAV